MEGPSSADITLFEKFRLDQRSGVLSRKDECGAFAPLPMGSRALHILGLLIERPGELVSRTEIFSAVWPDTAVEDSNLNVQIAALRRVLDEGRAEGSCIQTVPGRGYRFVGPVREVEPSAPPASGRSSGNGAASPIQPVSAVPTAVPTRQRRWLGLAATFLLLAVAGAAAAWVWNDRWVGIADTRPPLSMVVLPFTNLGPDADREDVAEAITAGLTTDLSRIPDIFLISRDRAFASPNRKLGVRYALEGSVQRSGSQVRVNAQLIDAETDTTLWAERFAGDIGNLFALQDDITRRMAIALDLELVNRAAGRLTEHSDALDYILRGRAAWNRRPASPDRYAETIDLFEGALKLDPGSVEAQGWLATALVGRVLDRMTVSPAADIARAEDLIGQALAASPFDPQAHIARGILFRWLGKTEEATFEFESVLAYNRNATVALFQLGWCKLMVGSIDEVIPAAQQVIHLKPHADLTNWYGRIGWTHLMLSHVDEAIPWLEKARSANPLVWPAHFHLASAYALKGDTERGAAELAETRRLTGGGSFSSIARMARGYWGEPKTRALTEATVFAGLRKAGMLEN